MLRNIKIRYRITLLVSLITAEALYALGTPLYQGALIFSFATVVALVYAQTLTRPLTTLDSSLKLISRGELPEKSYRKFAGEFGHMQSRLDDLVKILGDNAGFAEKVGEGKFDTPFV